MSRADFPDFYQALKIFEAMEHSLGLPDWQISGVYVWKLIRFHLFSAYLELHGLGETAHPEVQRLKPSKARIALRFAKLALTRNPFLRVQRDVQRFIIPHVRKESRNGVVVDPISYRSWAGCYRETSLVLDQASPLHDSFIEDSASYDVISFVGEVHGRTRRIRLSARDVRIIGAIQQTLGPENPGSEFDVLAIVVRATKNFIGVRGAFSRLLKKGRSSTVYLVVSYGKEAAIAAAQDMGITTVEFQHGAVGRGHLGYDFSGWNYVPYFPDKILAFGPSWFSKCAVPERCAVLPVGAPHIETAVHESMQTTGARSRQLLVLSQGPVARQLVEEIVHFARVRPDWSILVRPHPSENIDALRVMWDLHLRRTGVRVVVQNDRSLVQQAVESSVAVGVNSTGLVEALLAGCAVVFLLVPNSPHYFEELVDQGEAVSVTSGEGLARVVESVRLGSARGYFCDCVEDVVQWIEKV